MIYLKLFLGFLKVGCFSFGGAYAAIPLIRDVVLEYGWMTEDQLAYMIAVSESTPGPIMVNLATFTGASQAGLGGAALATFTVVLPAFLVILLAATVLRRVMDHPGVRAVLDGLAPCVTGIILATGVYMVAERLILPTGLDLQALALTAALAGILLFSRKVLRKKVSPISLIAISAGLGILVYGSVQRASF